MLTMYVEEEQDRWDEILLFLFMMVASVHDSTGKTPNEMMLGQNVTLHLHVVTAVPRTEELPQSSI